MRGMFGRKAAQATVSPTGDKGYGAPRTHSQRFVWTNRSNNVWRNELLPALYRRLHENDAHVSPQEQIIGGGIGEVQGVQAGSGKAKWKGNQAIENRWRRRIRKMDGSSSQRFRNHSRNDGAIQSR